MDLPSGVQPLVNLTRPTPKGSTATKIFQKKKEDLQKALKTSIEQAKGRYEENVRASYKEGVVVPDGADGTMKKITAAPNWRVQLNGKTKEIPYPHPVKVDSKDDREHPDEAVFIYLKAGRTKVPLFKSVNEEGEHTGYTCEMRLSSADLVATLEHFLAQVDAWEPETNETTKIFHMVGVVDAIAPLVRSRIDQGKPHAHCLETDTIVPTDKVKKESPYSLDTSIDSAMSVADMQKALGGA